MQKLFRSLIAIGGLAGLVACGDDVTVTEPTPVLTISGAPVTAIQVGARVQLSANEAVTWASSAANVATVDGTGLVTAVAAGTASITATATADVNRKASVTITVVALAVRSVTVAPASAILLNGQTPAATQGFVANVDADPGVNRSVTWTSSNAAVASINSTTGLATAVGVGSATITATSTANTSVTGVALLQVRNPTPATISISNITQAGVAGNPTVNVNNVVGSIDVNMNVDPGEQVVTRAEVLIDGNVACSQNLSGAQSEALRLAAAFEELEAVIVSCQINTAAFSATTGVANFANGGHTISARAIIAGGTQTATPSTQLTFNNASGVIVTLTTGTSVINAGTGFSWIGGGVTLNVVGVSYVAGTTVASVTCSIFGKTPVIALTSGTGSVAWTKTSTNWSATNSALNGYLSPAAESVACPSAVLSNGQPLVPAPGTTPVLNFGALGMTNAAMPALQVVRLDNVAPGTLLSQNGVAQIAIVVAPMTLPWVNATSTLTPSATGSGNNILGLPSLATLNAQTAGTDIEEGAAGITVTVNVPAAGGALPTTGGSCNITGLTAVTTGSQLAETTVSTAYPARIVFTDGVGNAFCMDLVQSFGADFTAPTATFTGPAVNTGYSAAPPAYAVTASDNASGFSLTGPLRVKMTRLNTDGTTSCVLGSGSSCTAIAQTMSFSATGGSATNGYYTTTVSIQDAAGNSVVLATDQLYSLDTVLPTFTGGISLPAVIAGAATNTFTTTVGDNLDLGSIFGVVAYPVGVNIQYATQQIGTFGPALEQSAANVGYAVSNWIRCLNTAGSFAVASGQPTTITLTVSDQTTLPAANVLSLASGAFGANAQACTGTGFQGSVGNIVAADILSFADAAPVYGTGLTAVDLDGQTVANTSSTSVTLSATAGVALNSSADPWTRVDFYYVNTAGNLVRIGTASAVLAQTQTTRTYTYTLVWDPAAPVQTGGVTVVAIGVDAQGDAVFAAGGQVVQIVP